ncbi:hypothetical protein F5Y04DRAFT_242356 [Hypomontagnella monticulosa]|nr:hypothetical protein F5Y04DRAFT_242356 [Hypomontagnella monticulosa]
MLLPTSSYPNTQEMNIHTIFNILLLTYFSIMNSYPISKEDTPNGAIPLGNGRHSRHNSIQMVDIPMSTSDSSYTYEAHDVKPPVERKKEYTVQEALEFARESPDGLEDPYVINVLEATLHKVWMRILEQPDDYVMSRTEFAVFNFMQREEPDKRRAALAAKARANYWNNIRGPG